MRPLRIVVVGAGHMGRHHARKVVELRSEGEALELAGVVDVAPERARRLGRELSARHGAHARALYARADAAIVAVPTVEHFAVAAAALDAGLDVLVEKPIAASLEQAERLLARARDRAAVLRVGHQEWFNPAMDVVRERVCAPRFAEAHRIGPFPERSTDVDVVRDLMIHDIDILQGLLREEPLRVDAVGVRVITDQIDAANARLLFPGGCVASLTASRVSLSALRRLELVQPGAYLSVDFLNPSAVIHRPGGDAPDGAARIEVEELKLEGEDALRRQLRAFADACRARDAAPPSDGDGARALRTALRVLEAISAARAPS